MIHEIDGVLCGRERNHKFEKNVPLMKSAIGECYPSLQVKLRCRKELNGYFKI